MFGDSEVSTTFAAANTGVAQLVEHRSPKPGVGSSVTIIFYDYPSGILRSFISANLTHSHIAYTHNDSRPIS